VLSAISFYTEVIVVSLPGTVQTPIYIITVQYITVQYVYTCFYFFAFLRSSFRRFRSLCLFIFARLFFNVLLMCQIADRNGRGKFSSVVGIPELAPARAAAAAVTAATSRSAPTDPQRNVAQAIADARTAFNVDDTGVFVNNDDGDR